MRVNAGRVLDLIHRHITGALCAKIFGRVRNTERQRRWALELLVRFWTAVILRAPRSLSYALAEAMAQQGVFYPQVQASEEAFFQRCRDLRPDFFLEVFHEFTKSLSAEIEPRFAAALAGVREKFPEVRVIDGSRLDPIAHKLKILRPERAAILPGALFGMYDPFRGICQGLMFTRDAATSELALAKEALLTMPEGVLLVGDRLYGTADFLQAVREARVEALVRKTPQMRTRRLQELGRGVHDGGEYTDRLVEAGIGPRTPTQRVRQIRWTRGRRVVVLLTTVLDPTRLSAGDALALYRLRWSIERMYFDLKEVLNLHRFYAANPNAVAMQVYAAAIVYNAMRVAQAEIARQARVEPEEVSPAKLFPRLAADAHTYALRQAIYLDEFRFGRRRLRLRNPAWLEKTRYVTYATTTILVRPREGTRRERDFHPDRATWKSYAHVKGAELT